MNFNEFIKELKNRLLCDEFLYDKTKHNTVDPNCSLCKENRKIIDKLVNEYNSGQTSPIKNIVNSTKFKPDGDGGVKADDYRLYSDNGFSSVDTSLSPKTKGCGKDVKVFWNSENENEGYSFLKCGDGIICKDCTEGRH